MVKLLDDLQHEQCTIARRVGSDTSAAAAAVAIHWVACRVYESHDRASDMLVVGVLLGQRSIQKHYSR